MARPLKKPGELGSVSFETRGQKVLARARIRSGGGKMVPISASGQDEAMARAALERRANEVWGFVPVLPSATIEILATSWIAELWERHAASPDDPVLREQTIEGYESVVRSTIKPALWKVNVEDVSVAFASSFLRRVAKEKSPATANSARNVLKQMFDLAIRHGAISQQVNPIQGTERFRKKKTVYIEYDLGQSMLILSLLAGWSGGPRDVNTVQSPNVSVLIDLILVILGSSERIGEPLALRYEDVRSEIIRDDDGVERLETLVYVGGTMIRTKAKGLRRQDSPKSARQKRWIELPGYAARVVRRRVANYVENRELNPDGLLFVNRKGKPFERQNLMRLLRSFRSKFSDELEAAGIEPGLLTFKAFRKTVATAITDEVGIERAAGLLGHSHKKITEAHYSKPRVPIVREAATLERAFEGLDR